MEKTFKPKPRKAGESDKISQIDYFEFFRDFRTNVPNSGVSRAKYYAVIKSLAKEMHKVLLNGDLLSIPFIGSLRIEKSSAPAQYKRFDYIKFNQTGIKERSYRKNQLECFHPKIVWRRLVAFPRYKYYKVMLPSTIWRQLLRDFDEIGTHEQYLETI